MSVKKIESITVGDQTNQCVSVGEAEIQRKISLGTNWNDICFAIRFNYTHPKEDYYVNPKGFYLGMMRSDLGGKLTDDTIGNFIGLQMLYTVTHTWNASRMYWDGDAYYRWVRRSGTTLNSYSSGSSNYAPRTFSHPDSGSVNAWLLHFRKNGSSSMLIEMAGSYGGTGTVLGLDATLQNVYDALESWDYATAQAILLGTSTTNRVGLQTSFYDFQNLDSLCIANFQPGTLHIHDVHVAQWDL